MEPQPLVSRAAGRLAGAAALLGLLAAGGCATLERGTSDRLAVISTPPGATATSSTGSSCVTPCALEVGRRDEFTVTIGRAGFVPKTVTVSTRVSDTGVGFFMENVVTAGVGGGVDLATGATLEHVPNPVSVMLAAAPNATAKPAVVRR